ncbi:hypothetical protein M422DRAFT_241109 [Sphaerobolus stellatus SS14]|nr:hypothetical protein M422DRAFT_241109 [Sphaerobolus stellatus SS14]
MAPHKPSSHYHHPILHGDRWAFMSPRQFPGVVRLTADFLIASKHRYYVGIFLYNHTQWSLKHRNNSQVNGSLAAIYERDSRILQSIAFSCTALSDFIISTSLLYFLRSKRTAFHDTRLAIARLILYSVNLGFLTTAFAVACLITWYTTSHSSFIFAIFFDFSGGVYVNSLLVSLNARRSIRRQMISGSLRTKSDFVPYSSVFNIDSRWNRESHELQRLSGTTVESL